MASENKVKSFLVSLVELIIAVGIPLAIGFGTGMIERGPWYQALKKPSFQPPDTVFPIVWIILYVCMGVASWLVYTKGGFAKQWIPLTFYVLQLIVNAFFTPTFFAWESLPGACGICVTLSVLVAITMFLFFSVTIPAGILFIPYLAWGLFATGLSIEYLRLNPDQINRVLQLSTGPFLAMQAGN